MVASQWNKLEKVQVLVLVTLFKVREAGCSPSARICASSPLTRSVSLAEGRSSAGGFFPTRYYALLGGGGHMTQRGAFV